MTNRNKLAVLSQGDDDEANMDIELPEEEDGREVLNFHVDDIDPYESDQVEEQVDPEDESDDTISILEEFE